MTSLSPAGVAAPSAPDAARPKRRTEPGALGRLLKQPLAVVMLALLALLGLLALLAPFVAPYSFDDQNLRWILKPPLTVPAGGPPFLLGTDQLGRDTFSRILYGARISLSVGLAGVTIGAAIGISLGLLAGYYGRWLDIGLMRLADIQLAFPYLLLAIAIITVFGPGIEKLVAVLGLRSWVVYARLVRGSVLGLKTVEFVQAARLLGARDGRIILRHVLPNAAAPVIVITSAELAALILLEATLSFLGLGVQPPAPSWGEMLSSGRAYLTNAWWLATFPGLSIMLAVLAVNVLGDALRDARDPRMKL